MPNTIDELVQNALGGMTLTVLRLQAENQALATKASTRDELLASLKALVSHAEDDTDDRRLSEEVTAAKAAIQKAEAT